MNKVGKSWIESLIHLEEIDFLFYLFLPGDLSILAGFESLDLACCMCLFISYRD